MALPPILRFPGRPGGAFSVGGGCPPYPYAAWDFSQASPIFFQIWYMVEGDELSDLRGEIRHPTPLNGEFKFKT